MKEHPKHSATRNIVVALNTAETGLPALQAAVRLAALLGAELKGVFVEDVNLVRLSELPFLRELRPVSLAEEAVSAQRMQRELRMLARHAQNLLEQTAGEMGVACSFQVWRGRAGAAALAQAFAADILSLGRAPTPVYARMRAGLRPRARRLPASIESVNVLFSDTPRAKRALTTACSLASEFNARLTVLVPASGAADRSELVKKVRALLEEHGQAARVVPLAAVDANSLVRAADTTANSVLIMEAEHPQLAHASLDQCMEALSCSVLLVR